MDYSELEATDGVVDVVDVALTKGLSAAKMTTLQRLSSHPKALGIGMANGSGGSRRRGSSSSLPALNASPNYPSQSSTMAKMTRRHSSSSASLRQLMRRGSTNTTGSAPPFRVDFSEQSSMNRRRRSSNSSRWSLGEEGDMSCFINETVAADHFVVGAGVANVVGQRRPSQNETLFRGGGSSRWEEEDKRASHSRPSTSAVRRSSSTASLRQIMRRGSIDTNDGTSCPPAVVNTVNTHQPSQQVRRRSSASSIWSMPEANPELDEEESGNVTDVAFSRGLSAAKMETLQRVSSEHKAVRLL